MKRYYCKNCGSVLIIPDGKHFGNCPVYGCNDPAKWGEEKIVIIPDYETLEQYEKRTGESYPDNGAVFQYRGDWYGGKAINWRWECKLLVSAKHMVFCKYPTKYIVIADPPILPPDDWRPE